MSDKIDPTAAPISADELRMSFLRGAELEPA